MTGSVEIEGESYEFNDNNFYLHPNYTAQANARIIFGTNSLKEKNWALCLIQIPAETGTGALAMVLI